MAASFESFSDGETFATIVGIGVGLIPFLRWNNALWNHGLFGTTRKERMPLLLLPFVGAAVLVLILVNFADQAVRNDLRYQGFFLIFGALWLDIALMVSSFFRLSLKQDVIERNNPAAVIGLTGVLTSFLIVYGGGNVGSGMTVGTTFASAILGSFVLAFGWFLIEITSSPAASITEDRDVSSAYRLSGTLIAMALIIGRAIAGNWVSIDSTVADLYLKGWPSAVFVILAIAMQFKLRPTPQNPHPEIIKNGIIPAAIEIIGAVAFLFAGTAYA